MKKEMNFSLPAVGISSLLVIFALLCLTVFSMLSVASASAHQRMAQSSREAVTGYYQADCTAQQILTRLRSGETPAGVQKEGNVYTYACAISDTQALAVCVRVDGGDYTVLRWQAVSTARWEADEKLPVWDGQ